MRRRWAALAVLGLAVGCVPAVADAQSAPPSAPGAAPGAAPATSPYRPGLGDLMTMTVQPRHTKLWAGGQAHNWAYAAYELHELQEAFDRAARAWPQWRSQPIADMVGALTKEPMAALDDAIKASDASRFTAAYARLTEACNACHQATGRAMIAIQVPRETAFPDQDFRPLKP